MNDADPDALTVSADGITLRKTVDADRFQDPAVVIELSCEGDDGERVRVVDSLPEGVRSDDVSFHPEHGAEHWSIEPDGVTFEHDLEPGEVYTTLYQIGDAPDGELGALLGEPTLRVVEGGPAGRHRAFNPDRSTAVRDFISGEAGLPGFEDQIGAAGGASEAADPSDPPETGADATAAEPEPSGAEAGTPASAVAAEEAGPGEGTAQAGTEVARDVSGAATGGVVRVLIEELREGEIDPEVPRRLRDELLDVDGTVAARVGHLQQRVTDLGSYTPAIEAFLDGEGTAEKGIAELRDDLGDLERDVRSAADRLDDAVGRLSTVDDRVDAVAGDVGSVRSRTDDLSDRLQAVEVDLDDVRERADDLEARLDGVSGAVDRGVERVAGVEGGVDDLRDELHTRRGDLRDDVRALEEDLEDFEVFRDRLSSVFGGTGDTSGTPDQGEGRD